MIFVFNSGLPQQEVSRMKWLALPSVLAATLFLIVSRSPLWSLVVAIASLLPYSLLYGRAYAFAVAKQGSAPGPSFYIGMVAAQLLVIAIAIALMVAVHR